VLSSIFSYAMEFPRKTGITNNPVKGMSKRRGGKKKAQARRPQRQNRVYGPLTFELMRLMLSESGKTDYRRWLGRRDAMIIETMAYQGLRPGECLYLRGEHLRSDRQTHVEDALSLEEPTGTKTGQIRDVPILKPHLDDLTEWRKYAGTRERDPLFPSARGKGLWTESMYRNWRRNTWRPLAKVVSVLVDRPELATDRPYACRHSFASLMLRAGGWNNLKELARIMGHDVAVLLSTYASEIQQYQGVEPINAEDEIFKAREEAAELVAEAEDRLQGNPELLELARKRGWVS
jgi:integrase